MNNAVTLQQRTVPTKSSSHDPITDEVAFYSTLYLMGIGTSLVSLFGVVSNIINFIIFLRENSRDCVSLCLIALTTSDLGAMAMNLIYSFSFFAKIADPGLTLDPDPIQYIMSWACNFFFDISMSTTAFLSVERCLCVVMPFHFKNMFTSRMALLSLLAIYLYNIGSYLPIFATMGFHMRFDPLYNKTRLKMWMSSNRVSVEKFSNIFTHITASTIIQLIVLISTQVMVIGLQRSSRLRKTKVASTMPVATITAKDTNNLTIGNPGLKDTNAHMHCRNGVDSSLGVKKIEPLMKKGLTNKNKSVSKMVSIVAGIFVACNFWRLALVYSRRIELAISPIGYLSNTYTFIIGIWQFIGAVNCSVNILVYYKYRTTYRQMFLKTFCQCLRSDAVEQT